MRLGDHLHPVVFDVDDAPRAGTEEEDVAWTALIHHLFVEFADTAPSGSVTRKSPRSGMVPALATASALPRAWG